MNQKASLVKALTSSDSKAIEAAAKRFLRCPEQVQETPPAEFIAALNSVNYSTESAIFTLACWWDRKTIVEALLDTFRKETIASSKSHLAWLIKNLHTVSVWKNISHLACCLEEPVQARRYLIESLDRLASASDIGWEELKNTIEKLKEDSNPEIRDAVVGLLISLKDNEEKISLLIEKLSDDNEWVIASAVNGILGIDDSCHKIDIDKRLIQKLLSNENPLVHENAKQLSEMLEQDNYS